MSVSSVSRHVAELEAHLDARLLNRTTRRLSLTETGQAFLERARAAPRRSRGGGSRRCRRRTLVPRGTLRMTCADHLRRRATSRPRSRTFVARHPAVRFDVELSDRIVDIVDEGFDLAVRIGATGSQDLVARRIGTTQLVCCASPGVSRAARRARRTPDDLARHRCLTYEYLAGARHLARSATRRATSAWCGSAGPVHANNGRFLAALAAEDVGIALRARLHRGRGHPRRAAGGRCSPDSRRRNRPSTWCTRAAATSRPRCARSSTSWSRASSARRPGGCRSPRRAGDR